MATQKVSDRDWIDEEGMQRVLFSLGINEWDAVIFSDGSGTTWKKAIGFAAVMVDRHKNHWEPVYGAVNRGTNYLAELLPYVHALSWYVEGPGRELLLNRLKLYAKGRVVIHAITDSEIVAKIGNGLANGKTGNYYWAMIEAVHDHGFDVHWHWIERATAGLNRVCDHLAGLKRVAIQALEPDIPTAVAAHPLYAPPETPP